MYIHSCVHVFVFHLRPLLTSLGFILSLWLSGLTKETNTICSRFWKEKKLNTSLGAYSYLHCSFQSSILLVRRPDVVSRNLNHGFYCQIKQCVVFFISHWFSFLNNKWVTLWQTGFPFRGHKMTSVMCLGNYVSHHMIPTIWENTVRQISATEAVNCVKAHLTGNPCYLVMGFVHLVMGVMYVLMYV